MRTSERLLEIILQHDLQELKIDMLLASMSKLRERYEIAGDERRFLLASEIDALQPALDEKLKAYTSRLNELKAEYYDEIERDLDIARALLKSKREYLEALEQEESEQSVAYLTIKGGDGLTFSRDVLSGEVKGLEGQIARYEAELELKRE